MVLDWFRTLAILSLAASLVSALAIATDIAAGRRQKMWVMDLVWPITALYFGPLGLGAYWTMGRSPPGTQGREMGLREGLWAAIKADTISLVAFEVGMLGVMALNRLVLFDRPPEPNTAMYWFLMQIALIVGFATSYPANWWLVKAGWKEAM